MYYWGCKPKGAKVGFPLFNIKCWQCYFTRAFARGWCSCLGLQNPTSPQLEPTARSDSDTWERHPSFVISLHNTQRRLLSLPLKWKWWKNILPPGRVMYGWGKKSVEAGEGSFVCWGDGRMKLEWRLQKTPLPPPQAARTWPVPPYTPLQKPFVGDTLWHTRSGNDGTPATAGAGATAAAAVWS